MQGQTKTPWWVEELRVCCEALRHASPQVIGGLSLTIPLDDTPDFARSALDLSERMAEEYGLCATAHLEGSALTIRLSQREPPGEAGGETTDERHLDCPGSSSSSPTPSP
ncbi:MAG: hypothetical protein HY690_09185 [Chloroflexi bacterium]|nr:hypothetical protein [Chloroflexota bacterium]